MSKGDEIREMREMHLEVSRWGEKSAKATGVCKRQ